MWSAKPYCNSYCIDCNYCRLDIPLDESTPCHYFQDLPIWRTGTKSLSSSEIIRSLLFEREYIQPWICHKQPLSVNQNATFIIDLSKLPSSDDVFADDMGVWKHTGSPSQYFQVRKNEFGGLQELVSLGKKRPDTMSCDMYWIKKNYSCHHAASHLSRTVIFLEGMYIIYLVY